MHDLRKKVLLESGKTVSKKAGSKQATPAGSKVNSPAHSRAPSRNVSDDESEFSDGTQWGTNSDELLDDDNNDQDVVDDAWIADLHERMEQIIDRKRSSAQGREATLNAFTYNMTRHYLREEIQTRMGELLPAVLKSVKSGQTERETVLALKAIALMLVTVPSDTIYDAIAGPVKSTITDAQHPTAKIAAIHVLGIATFYGGASVEETEEVMDFFLEIVSSDGAVVEEQDDAEIVTAALEEWGFLATQLEDMEETTEIAMETFVDQLESIDAGVQIAAGDNIALMFEKSYTEAEPDDELPEDENDDKAGHGPRMVKRYTVWRQQHQLEHTLESLSKMSNKRMSKKNRKDLHMTFADVLTTVERPTRGPRYSTALDPDGFEYGSRMKVSVSASTKVTINKWWKLHRLNGLKRLLQSGFLQHWEHNDAVFDSLPVNVAND